MSVEDYCVVAKVQAVLIPRPTSTKWSRKGKARICVLGDRARVKRRDDSLSFGVEEVWGISVTQSIERVWLELSAMRQQVDPSALTKTNEVAAEFLKSARREIPSQGTKQG